jgi:hypothetical protein
MSIDTKDQIVPQAADLFVSIIAMDKSEVGQRRPSFNALRIS